MPGLLPIQMPIGSEASFEGVIDLIENKAYGKDGERDKPIEEMPIPAGITGKGKASPS